MPSGVASDGVSLRGSALAEAETQSPSVSVSWPARRDCCDQVENNGRQEATQAHASSRAHLQATAPDPVRPFFGRLVRVGSL
mmetsp:Transcript_28849/g.88461  ORF Transcript_28849/g.88461 Transcript_28849/m.88461 type:complete len:82 (+) Transcript_28849:3050-3295(+)